MKNQKFRKLEVWKKTIFFVKDVYKFTEEFPKEEMYGLTSQLKRATTSIALNIAEGAGADSDIEFRRFLSIALRSAYEVMCAVEIAHELEFCNEQSKEGILQKCDEICAMLTGLKKRLKADS